MRLYRCIYAFVKGSDEAGVHVMTIDVLPDEPDPVRAVHLPGGEKVTVRPARPQDTSMIQAYIRGLGGRDLAAQNARYDVGRNCRTSAVLSSRSRLIVRD